MKPTTVYRDSGCQNCENLRQENDRLQQRLIWRARFRDWLEYAETALTMLAFVGPIVGLVYLLVTIDTRVKSSNTQTFRHAQKVCGNHMKLGWISSHANRTVRMPNYPNFRYELCPIIVARRDWSTNSAESNVRRALEYATGDWESE